jgi:hypothetical protein
MRDEGIFVLEWLAYHAGLGFDAMLVVTNDCRDGSDALLAHMASQGHLHHVDQVVPPGVPPQDSGMDRALAWARDIGLTHLLHIDSDEFLWLDPAQGDLAALMARTAGADVVPIPWRAFGDNGLTAWTPGDLVTERNTRAAPAPEPGVSKSKCLFRVASFAAATDHAPRRPLVAAPVVLNPDGATLSNTALFQERASRFRPHDVAAGARSAQIFHYAVRARDVFGMKADRGDGQGKDGAKYRLGGRWHRIANRNDADAPQMAAQLPRVRATLGGWRDDPEIARREAVCRAWFTARRAELGQTGAQA